MTLCISTVSVGEYPILLKRFNDQRRAYGEMHGVDVHTLTDNVDPAVHPSWLKLYHIRQCMDRYDWVYYMDADAMFYDMHKSLTIWPMKIDCDWLCVQTSHSQLAQLGCFYIKSTKRNKEIMEWLWNQRRAGDDKRYEEIPFDTLRKSGNVPNLRLIDDVAAASFNRNYRDGYIPKQTDFVIHFCEMKNPLQMIALFDQFTYAAAHS